MVRRLYRAAALALAAVVVFGLFPVVTVAAVNEPVSMTLQGTPLTTKGELIDGTTFVPLKELGVELGSA
ncbi:MAG TPA: hypothetical protein GX716_09485 [Firmicutes bacterium]|jgi:hypothetical protein|nr:hypothetical protein [Candidatus Fermentithermobacillaceae bacterium]